MSLTEYHPRRRWFETGTLGVFTRPPATFLPWLQAHLAEFGFFFLIRKMAQVSLLNHGTSATKTAQMCLQQLTLDQLSTQLDSAPILGKECVRQGLKDLQSIHH